MSNQSSVTFSIGTGSVIGVVLAMQLSYEKWHHLGWEIAAGIFGWFYCLYYWIEYSK
jgi:hypothetical protein